MITSKNAVLRVLIAAALLGSGLVATASSANAAGGESGQLLIRGPGSLYSGQNANVAESVAAGATATFSLEIRNTGSSTEQFNVVAGYSDRECTAACSAREVLTTGGVDVTALAASPNGYFTSPIAPGGTQVYQMKITPATGSTPGDYVQYFAMLNDTAGYERGVAFADVNVIRNKGTGGADQFVSSPGTPATSGPPSAPWSTFVSAPSVAVNKTFTYTVKLMNDSPAPSVIRYFVVPLDQTCSSYFPLRIMQGTKNVTLSVVRQQYSTGMLAHGASVALTITGTSLPGGEDCLLGPQSAGTGNTGWYSRAANSSGGSVVSLLFAPADAYTPPAP